MEGLAAVVKKTMDADDVAVTPIEGGLRVDARRGDRQLLKFHLYDDHVLTVGITSDSRGWFDTADVLAGVLQDHFGIDYFEAHALGDEAAETLERHNYTHVGGSLYRSDRPGRGA